MVIYFGADHRGFELKEQLKEYFAGRAYEVIDLGNETYEENDDFPVFAAKVGEKVSWSPDNGRGILVCGSGVGVCVAANKFRNVRAATAISSDQIYDARRHDDVNVLCLSSDSFDFDAAKAIAQVFLDTSFDEEERHRRRLGQILTLEEKNMK